MAAARADIRERQARRIPPSRGRSATDPWQGASARQITHPEPEDRKPNATSTPKRWYEWLETRKRIDESRHTANPSQAPAIVSRPDQSAAPSPDEWEFRPPARQANPNTASNTTTIPGNSWRSNVSVATGRTTGPHADEPVAGRDPEVTSAQRHVLPPRTRSSQPFLLKAQIWPRDWRDQQSRPPRPQAGVA